MQSISFNVNLNLTCKRTMLTPRKGSQTDRHTNFSMPRIVQPLHHVTSLINRELSVSQALSSVLYSSDSQLACSLQVLLTTDLSMGGRPKRTHLQECWHDIIRGFSSYKYRSAHFTWWLDMVKTNNQIIPHQWREGGCIRNWRVWWD